MKNLRPVLFFNIVWLTFFLFRWNFLVFVARFRFSLCSFPRFPRVSVRFSPTKNTHTRDLIIVGIRKFSSVVSTHHVFPPSWQIFSCSLAHALSCILTNWLAARSFSGRIFLAAVSSSSAVHVVVVVTGGKEKNSYPEIFLTFSHIFPQLIESNNLSWHDPNSFCHSRWRLLFELINEIRCSINSARRKYHRKFLPKKHITRTLFSTQSHYEEPMKKKRDLNISFKLS